jgi:hypothetical protein
LFFYLISTQYSRIPGEAAGTVSYKRVSMITNQRRGQTTASSHLRHDCSRSSPTKYSTQSRKQLSNNAELWGSTANTLFVALFIPVPKMSLPASPSHEPVSPDDSPAHSTTLDLVPLEALVSHLLASKRSLSSISTVWRANEIVTSARSALEESVILSSKTMYLRDGISEQVKILRNVRGGIEDVYKEGQREFEVPFRGGLVIRKEANIAECNSNSG